MTDLFNKPSKNINKLKSPKSPSYSKVDSKIGQKGIKDKNIEPIRNVSKDDKFFKAIKTTKGAYLKSPYFKKQKTHGTNASNTFNHSTYHSNTSKH